MIFERELISVLTQNGYISNGVSMYGDKPAIFPYYVSSKAAKPYIKFYTENYNVPTKSETKILVIEYVNDEIDLSESQKYSVEIINTLDARIFESDENGELRLYLSGNTSFEGDTLKIRFILRGDLKLWGVV